MNALEVKSEVVINHWELGKAMAEWSNEEQAHFLHGLSIGFQELPGAGHLQLHYIVEALDPSGPHLADVREFVELLGQYFAEESA